MNELLMDRAMSCASENLSLIKTLAEKEYDASRQLITAAATCTEHCLLCIRSCETGSVLPETLEQWCQACQNLLNLIEAHSPSLPDLAAAAEACENCIRSCSRQPV